jgi:glucose/arabinose dehydrogenase
MRYFISSKMGTILSSTFIRTTRQFSFLLLASSMILFSDCAAFGPGGTPQLKKIKLPPGFKIDFYAPDVPGARSLTLSPSGIVFVGSRGEGKVYALLDTDNDERVEKVITIASGLDQPNGVTFYNGALYVAESHRIIRYDEIETHLDNPPPPVVVKDSFPADGEHDWKYLRAGPDGYLYVSVGSPFNVGEPNDSRYATIMQLKPDGTEFQIFAHGVRNSMGFDWQPENKGFWFTDNGRDWLGENLPPDELNHAFKPGEDFGWPYFYGKNEPDPQYGKKAKNYEYTPSVLDLGAHVAALGMRFYTGKMFPKEYENQIFICEHGSWNRIVPTGYRVVCAQVSGDSGIGYQIFAQGWLQGMTAWGRPVDVLVMPDGALLVSDDKGGAVYRISYQK